MAHLTAHDLIQPHGPLTTTLFPKLDVNGLAVLVEAWLTRAYAHPAVVAETAAATQNTMARAYALYLAFMDVYTRMLAEPNSVDVDEKGSSSYTDEQRAGMLRLANQYLDEFTALVPTADAVRVTPGSATIPVQLAW